MVEEAFFASEQMDYSERVQNRNTYVGSGEKLQEKTFEELGITDGGAVKKGHKACQRKHRTAEIS